LRDSSLRPANVLVSQWDIPLNREVHAWGIGPLIFNKADTHDVTLVVLEKEPDALESACVTGPPACARDTPRELF
jgi:hypothetical protein